MAQMSIDKLSDDRYRIIFKAEIGKVVCEISVKALGRLKESEKRLLALKRAKGLTRALHEAIG
jgi:hypothetical protein